MLTYGFSGFALVMHNGWFMAFSLFTYAVGIKELIVKKLVKDEERATLKKAIRDPVPGGVRKFIVEKLGSSMTDTMLMYLMVVAVSVMPSFVRVLGYFTKGKDESFYRSPGYIVFVVFFIILGFIPTLHNGFFIFLASFVLEKNGALLEALSKAISAQGSFTGELIVFLVSAVSIYLVVNILMSIHEWVQLSGFRLVGFLLRKIKGLFRRKKKEGT